MTVFKRLLNYDRVLILVAVVILLIISLLVRIITVQYVIVITFRSVNIVKDKNRVVLCSCQYDKNTKLC